MAVPTLLFSLQLLVGAVNFESSVKSDGFLVAVKLQLCRGSLRPKKTLGLEVCSSFDIIKTASLIVKKACRQAGSPDVSTAAPCAR